MLLNISRTYKERERKKGRLDKDNTPPLELRTRALSIRDTNLQDPCSLNQGYQFTGPVLSQSGSGHKKISGIFFQASKKVLFS